MPKRPEASRRERRWHQKRGLGEGTATHVVPNGNALPRRSFLGLAGATASAAFLTACTRSNSSSAAPGGQTLNWWHIQNTDPMLSVWARLASDFEAAHPGVKINITPLENVLWALCFLC